MTYSLEEFCADCHAALNENPGADGRENVRAQLEKLLVNQDFVEEHLSPQGSGKSVLITTNPPTFMSWPMAQMRVTVKVSRTITAHPGRFMAKR